MLHTQHNPYEQGMSGSQASKSPFISPCIYSLITPTFLFSLSLTPFVSSLHLPSPLPPPSITFPSPFPHLFLPSSSPPLPRSLSLSLPISTCVPRRCYGKVGLAPSALIRKRMTPQLPRDDVIYESHKSIYEGLNIHKPPPRRYVHVCTCTYIIAVCAYVCMCAYTRKICVCTCTYIIAVCAYVCMCAYTRKICV